MGLPLYSIEREYSVFSRKLKNTRRLKRVSQQELADLLGHARCKITYIENNQKRILLHDAVRIAKKLKISLDQLFNISVE